MKDKIRLDLSDSEKRIIVKALNLMRNCLKEQDRSTNSIDEILLKISDTRELKFDIVDTKIIINSLNIMRDELVKNNEPRGEINDILLKIIDETDKKSLFKETER